MRDSSIFSSFEKLEAKVGHDINVVLEAMNVIETRQRALEFVLLSSRFALLKLAVVQLFSPRMATQAVFLRQQNLLSTYRAKMTELLKKKATGLIRPAATLTAAVVIAFLAGCVPYPVYRNRLAAAQQQVADSERRAQYCEQQQVKLTDVLREQATGKP